MSGEDSTIRTSASSKGQEEQLSHEEDQAPEKEAAAATDQRGPKPEVLQILSVLAAAHAVGLFYTDHILGGLVLLAAGIAGLIGKRFTRTNPFAPSTYWDWVGECHQKTTKWLSTRGRIERQPFDSHAYQRYDSKPLHISEVATLEAIFLATGLSPSSIERHLDESTARVHIIKESKYRADTAFAAIMLSLAANELLPPELSDVAQRGLGLGFQLLGGDI